MFYICSMNTHPEHSPHATPARVNSTHDFAGRFWYWRGASGRRYIHSVYKAGQCPPLPGAIFVGVQCDENNVRRATGIGRFDPSCDSAEPGAACNEVHVHLLAEGDDEAQAIFEDLQSAFAALNGSCTGPGAAGTAPAKDRLHSIWQRPGGFEEHQLPLFSAA